jgi:hypothetical protein
MVLINRLIILLFMVKYDPIWQNLYKVDSSCKKPLVICNSIFSIFLNQIKAQKDQKIIVWIEYGICTVLK